MQRRSRLAVLIRLAELAEQRMLVELGRAAQRCAAAERELASVEARLVAARQAASAVGVSRSAAELVQLARHAEHLQRSRGGAAAAQREAAGGLESARSRTAAARLRVRALAKVEHRRATQLRLTAQRREQARREALERALRGESERADG